MNIGRSLCQQGRIRVVKRCLPLPTDRGDRFFHFCLIGIQHNITSGLDDPAFCRGDLFHGITKILRVFQTDIGDHCHFRSRDHIRTVQLSSHTYFQNNDLTLFRKEIQHGNGSGYFKLTGMILHLFRLFPHLLCDRCKCIRTDPFPVDLKALTEAHQVGRSI